MKNRTICAKLDQVLVTVQPDSRIGMMQRDFIASIGLRKMCDEILDQSSARGAVCECAIPVHPTLRFRSVLMLQIFILCTHHAGSGSSRCSSGLILSHFSGSASILRVLLCCSIYFSGAGALSNESTTCFAPTPRAILILAAKTPTSHRPVASPLATQSEKPHRNSSPIPPTIIKSPAQNLHSYPDQCHPGCIVAGITRTPPQTS